MSGKRATLSAVAGEVGVSRTTVSNAYNRPDQLSPALRARILEVAERLGYAGPDPVARSLRTRKADAIGLLLTERMRYAFRDPGAYGFLDGVAEVCEGHGLSLLLVPAVSAVPGVTDTVRRAAVDGFLVYSMPADDPYTAAVLTRPQPVVIVDSPRGVASVDFVGIDDRGAFRMIGDHVRDLGHRRIGVVSVDAARLRREREVPLAEAIPGENAVMSQRLAGLADALASESDVSVTVAQRPAHERIEGARGAALLLGGHRPPTVIVCTSDVLALGVLDELSRRGMRTPADVSVTGFDDVPEAAAAGLTTVRQPMAEKGRTAAERLLSQGAEPRHEILPVEFVIRSSSGPPS